MDCNFHFLSSVLRGGVCCGEMVAGNTYNLGGSFGYKGVFPQAIQDHLVI